VVVCKRLVLEAKRTRICFFAITDCQLLIKQDVRAVAQQDPAVRLVRRVGQRHIVHGRHLQHLVQNNVAVQNSSIRIVRLEAVDVAPTYK